MATRGDKTRASRARRPASKKKRGARLVGRALDLGTETVPLYSGAVHYWRLDPSAWAPALSEIARLGLPIVETYIPWGAHEVSEGELDFGERDERLDVGRFLDLAHEQGLYVFVRPGPHINAEMTYFGIPERIVYDKRCQARSPRQNPVILPWPPRMFPVPSYASTAYHRETGLWYDAVGEIVEPRIWPEGPVVLAQVDNEAAYYFRNGPYDQDYHPDSVAQYRSFLEERYETVERAAEAHRREWVSWDDVEPPTRFSASRPDELVVHLDWAEFQERLICTAVGKMKRRMGRAGIGGVPMVHNVPLGEGGLPVNMPALETVVDLTGLDYYHSVREHRTIKRRTLYLAGTFSLPYSPELGVGAPPWFTPLRHEDSLYTAMVSLAYGLRGFNLYMAVDRDRWYGAPIAADGKPRDEAGTWAKLMSTLSDLRFHELERRADVALVIPQEYRRLSRATHLLGGVVSPSAMEAVGGTPVDACREDPLGFKGPVQVLWWRMLAKVSDALTRAGVPYVYVDSDAPLEQLTGRKVIVAPSYEFASTARWERMLTAAKGGATVVYGPAVPELDEEMRPHLFKEPKSSRRVLFDTDADAEALVADLLQSPGLERPFAVEPAPLEATVHEDVVGPRVLFVVNPGEDPIDGCVELPEPLELVDVMTDERFEGGETVAVPMPAFGCRMLRIELKTKPAKARPSAKRGNGGGEPKGKKPRARRKSK